eukprot:gb/GEZN01000083.1/.p1 GENE.gb/GEZN01000083.1/~~gb/GEZN01000083.1/.p1  ORF type:complete len:2433 (-),score=354.77 gb/GEZN01000083.1/:111-7409(-)
MSSGPDGASPKQVAPRKQSLLLPDDEFEADNIYIDDTSSPEAASKGLARKPNTVTSSLLTPLMSDSASSMGSSLVTSPESDTLKINERSPSRTRVSNPPSRKSSPASSPTRTSEKPFQITRTGPTEPSSRASPARPVVFPPTTSPELPNASPTEANLTIIHSEESFPGLPALSQQESPRGRSLLLKTSFKASGKVSNISPRTSVVPPEDQLPPVDVEGLSDSSEEDEDITFNSTALRWFGNKMMSGQVFIESQLSPTEVSRQQSLGSGLDMTDIKKAFQGIDPSKVAENKPNIWIKSDADKISPSVGLDELRRLYSALYFLINEKKFEESIEEDNEEDEEDFPDAEGNTEHWSNSFLSQAREKHRWKRLITAHQDADMAEDAAEEEEDQELDEEVMRDHTMSVVDDGGEDIPIVNKGAQLSEKEMETLKSQDTAGHRRRRSLIKQARKSLREKPGPGRKLLEIFPDSVDENAEEGNLILHQTTLSPPGARTPARRELSDVKSLGSELVEESLEDDDTVTWNKQRAGLNKENTSSQSANLTQDLELDILRNSHEGDGVLGQRGSQDLFLRELPLDRNITKIDLETLDKFVPEKLHRGERLHYLNVWKSVGDTDPCLSKLEGRSYRELMRLLDRIHTKGAALNLEDPKFVYEDLELKVVNHTVAILQYLREIEINPRTWHPGGFLNRVDNVLAVLIYRREGSDEEDPAQVAQKASGPILDLPNTEKFARLLAEMSPRKCPLALKYVPAFIVMLLLLVGIYVLWASFHYRSLSVVFESGVVLTIQIRSYAEETLRTQFFQNSKMLGWAYHDLARRMDLNMQSCWIDSNSPDCVMNQFILDPLLDSSASGVTLISSDGLWLESWKRGGTGLQEPIQFSWLDSTATDPNCRSVVVRSMEQTRALTNGSSSMSNFRSSIYNHTSTPTSACAGPWLSQDMPAQYMAMALRNTSAMHWTSPLAWPADVHNPSTADLPVLTLVVPLLKPLNPLNGTNATVNSTSVDSLQGVIAIHFGLHLFRDLLETFKSKRAGEKADGGGAWLQLVEGGSSHVLLTFRYQSAQSGTTEVFKAAQVATSDFTKQTVTNPASRNFYEHEVIKNDAPLFTVSAPIFVPVPPQAAPATPNWYIVAVVPLDNYYGRVLTNDSVTYSCMGMLIVAALLLAYQAFKKKTIYVHNPVLQKEPSSKNTSYLRKNRRTLQQLFRDKPYYQSILVVGTLLTFCVSMVVITFSVWAGSVGYQTNLERQGFYEVQSEVRNEVERMLAVPPSINKQLLRLYARGLLKKQDGLASVDEIFVDLLRHVESPYGVKRAIVEHVYLAYANGDFIGAQFTHRNGKGSDGEIVITVKDGSTTPTPHCLTKYLANQNGERDLSKILWVNGDCTYDPRKRPFYQVAKAALQDSLASGDPRRLGDNLAQWTDLFSFSSGGADAENDNLGPGDLGLTAMLPFTVSSEDNTLAGVFGVDFSLGVLNERMVLLNDRMDEVFKRLKVIVVDRDGTLISSSHIAGSTGIKSEITAMNPDDPISMGLVAEYYKEQVNLRIPMLGTESSDQLVNETVYYLTKEPNDLHTMADSPIVHMPLSAPETGVLGISPDGGQGIRWVSIMVNANVSATQETENLAWILSFGIILILIYLALKALKQIQRKYFFTKDHKENALRLLGGQKVRKQDLVQLMITIRPIILRSANNNGDCPTNKHEPWSLIEYDEMSGHYTKMAIQHIKNCRKKRNILTLATLHDYDSPWPLFLYILYTRGRYKVVIYSVCVIHAAIIIWKPPTAELLKVDGLPAWIIATEFLCCAVEALDCVLKLLMIYLWEMDNILSPKGEAFDTITRLILVVMIFFDNILAASIRVSVQYIFPLRPWMIVLKNSYLRKAASNFWETLQKAGSVLLMFVALVVCGAVIGIPLLRDIFSNTLSDGRVALFVPSPSFENFFTSLTTIFVFVTTGENYTDLVYPALSVNSWLAIYFIILVLIGMFFVLALVIGVFQDGFKMAREKVAQKRALFKRTGTVSAFILLDLHMEESITQEQFEEFIIARAPQLKVDRTPLEAISLMLNKRSKHDRVDIQDFVVGNEMLALESRKYKTKIKPWKLQLQHFFDKEWFRTCIVACVLLHLWVLCLYGTFQKESILDGIQITIMGLYVLELTSKTVAFSFNRYWNSAFYMMESGSSSWVNKARTLRNQMRAINKRDSAAPAKQRESYAPQDPTPDSSTRRRKLARANTSAIPIIKGVSSTEEFQRIQRERREQQKRAYLVMFSHRADFVLVVGCALALVIIGLFDVVLHSITINVDTYRFIMSLTILRLFTLFLPLRKLAYSLFQAFPTLWPLLSLTFIIFYVYAIIGVSHFYQQFLILQGRAPQGSFDNIGDGILLLFQVFTGESWHEVMYAGINVLGWASSGYFITFVVLVAILFGNLFTALFLDLRSEHEQEELEEQNAIQQTTAS